MNHLDTIVIGLGGMGSATLARLAQRGQHVLGLEQFDLDHTLGSSHGQSRIIRQAYFEHPDYVPLIQRAYTGWEQLAAETEVELMNLCGLVLAGNGDGEVVTGTRKAAELHGLPLEIVPQSAWTARYPALRFDESMTVLHDPLGGYLRVEACVAAHLASARRAGATILAHSPVREWHVEGAGVMVHTDKNRYRADRLVLCAGSWSGRLLQRLNLPLTVRRVATAWFPSARPQALSDAVFAFQTGAGFFYGFPELDGRGVKIACHEPGEVVTDPGTVDRNIRPSDIDPLRSFARNHVPQLAEDPIDATVCLYTMSPDGHFIVDRHPEYEQVVFAAGFSGHGFKFCPAIGTILADLAMEGQSHLPWRFLGLDRFQDHPATDGQPPA